MSLVFAPKEKKDLRGYFPQTSKEEVLRQSEENAKRQQEAAAEKFREAQARDARLAANSRLGRQCR